MSKRKVAGRQRAIGAAADEIGVSPATLRLYERLGLLHPARDSTGRRTYGDSEIAQGRAVKEQRLAARGSGLLNQSRVEAS